MPLTTKSQAPKYASSLQDMQAAAQARLSDFKALMAAKQYSGAVYMGRYVVELYLKCLICKRIKQSSLHKVFFSHDLPFLLFFTGFESDLKKRNKKRFESFEKIKAQDSDQLRYQNPKNVTLSNCKEWDRWLNDRQEGLVPWLQKKLDQLR